MNIQEVFTTLRVVHKKPQWLREHLERLHAHASAAGIPIPCHSALDAESMDPGSRAGVTSSSSHLLRIALNHTGYTFSTRPLLETPQVAQLYLSDQIAPSTLKTSKRDPYAEALRQAKVHAAFEGLLLDHNGHVVDGCRSSLILRQGNTLISLKGGIEGITRNMALQHAASQGFIIRHEHLKPNELKGELWIAGSGVGLLPAALKSRYT